MEGRHGGVTWRGDMEGRHVGVTRRGDAQGKHGEVERRGGKEGWQEEVTLRNGKKVWFGGLRVLEYAKASGRLGQGRGVKEFQCAHLQSIYYTLEAEKQRVDIRVVYAKGQYDGSVASMCQCCPLVSDCHILCDASRLALATLFDNS